MPEISLDYISTGGNRHPQASDWDRSPAGLLAFGADNNIAIWDPLVSAIRQCVVAVSDLAKSFQGL